MGWRRGLAVVAAAAAPALLFGLGRPRWSLGLLLGEFLGLVNFIWLSLAVRRAFVPSAKIFPARFFLWNSLGRYVLITAVLYLSLRWPMITIWSVAAGFTLIQWPAAIWRLDAKPQRRESL